MFQACQSCDGTFRTWQELLEHYVRDHGISTRNAPNGTIAYLTHRATNGPYGYGADSWAAIKDLQEWLKAHAR